MLKITRISGREILDSRGNPTLEATVTLENGTEAAAAVPSGASTGRYEALELRDGDESRYGGMGVTKAAANLNGPIREALLGMDAEDFRAADLTLLALDGTPDKSSLGANATLAVSLAVARAASKGLGMPLYRFLGGALADTLPVPMMNVLNGGRHASNNIDIQEFMIMPVGAPAFSEGLRWCTEVFHALGALLKSDGLATGVGDEGGYAPDLSSDESALDYLLRAVERAGYQAERDFVLAIDAAASEWRTPEGYTLPKRGERLDAEGLIAYWKKLCARYPIRSIEDGLGEEDWSGWRQLTSALGDRVQLVGDDLFVTNVQRLSKGIEGQCGNALLVKPNQIGTLTETIDAVLTAKRAGYAQILSHRSGETPDTSIADIAVGLGATQIKAGAPSRGERVAKYNRLLEIQASLGERARWPGPRCFGQ